MIVYLHGKDQYDLITLLIHQVWNTENTSIFESADELLRNYAQLSFFGERKYILVNPKKVDRNKWKLLNVVENIAIVDNLANLHLYSDESMFFVIKIDEDFIFNLIEDKLIERQIVYFDEFPQFIMSVMGDNILEILSHIEALPLESTLTAELIRSYFPVRDYSSPYDVLSHLIFRPDLTKLAYALECLENSRYLLLYFRKVFFNAFYKKNAVYKRLGHVETKRLYNLTKFCYTSKELIPSFIIAYERINS